MAAFILIVVFAGGAYLAGGGFVDLMDLSVGMTVSEMKGMYASDVPAARKKSLDAAVERLRKNLREERIAVTALQPFLDTLKRVTSDDKVSAAEAAELEAAVEKINATAKR